MSPYERMTDKLIASRQDNANCSRIIPDESIGRHDYQLIARRQDIAKLEQDNAR